MMMVPGTLDELNRIKDLKEAKDTWREDGNKMYDSMNALLKTMESMKSDVSGVKGGLANLDQARGTVGANRKQIEALSTQALADLREIVFNQQRSVPQEKEEPAKIAFPYRTDRRVIAFGGHDSWLREIKFKVPDVRFMGEDISSAEVIRRADVVWIQTNCIGHNTYYNVIDLVRRYGRKVRYFKYASAVKCAEQVAEEEEKSKA